MNLSIRGLGTAVPDVMVSQAEALAVAKVLCCRNEDDKTVAANLYRQTGIDQRHMVIGRNLLYDLLHGTTESNSTFLPTGRHDERGPTTRQRMQIYIAEALPLARLAARRALDQAKLPAADITHLVTVSCTGFTAPGVDIGLIEQLGLRPTVERVHVGFMGCHGALNGLRVAQAFAAQPQACVLLCAVELSSLHYAYGWDPKKLVANALFADGAAAVVGVSAREGSAQAWQTSATGSCLLPESTYAMTWNIGDHGFDMTLSTRVPGLIAEHLRPWMERWLRQNGLSLTEVGSWAVHPGGPRIVDAVEECLGLDKEALAVSRAVLAEYGNMSSPTILFILDRLRAHQAPRPCVALGFGPGLMAEAVLFR